MSYSKKPIDELLRLDQRIRKDSFKQRAIRRSQVVSNMTDNIVSNRSINISINIEFTIGANSEQ